MAAVKTAGPSTSLRYGPSTSGRDDDNSVAGSTTVPSHRFSQSLMRSHTRSCDTQSRGRCPNGAVPRHGTACSPAPECRVACG